MRRALSLSLLAGLASLLAGCPELLEPQATVTSGQNAPTIDQAQAIPYNGPRALRRTRSSPAGRRGCCEDLRRATCYHQFWL